MKSCFKCGQTKPYSDFYKHPAMKDGYLGKCKECTKSDVQDNYAKRRPQYSGYDRKRNENPLRRELKRVYSRNNRENNKAKVRARRQLNNAVRDGRIIKLPCEICGSVDSEGHHDDYTKPLKVRWLCFKHHREVEHDQVVTAA